MATDVIKNERIALRMTAEQKSRIERASKAQGFNLTEFSVQTLVQRAEEVLADQSVFHVSEEQWAELDSLLSASLSQNPGYQRLQEVETVFEQ